MFCISISHKRAPAHIREQYAFTREERFQFLSRLKEEGLADGAVLLCTCNRSELYVSSPEGREGQEALERVQQAYAAFKQVPDDELFQYLNSYEGETAIAHLFKVCGGFESKILGEDEILRQVKEAYEEARDWQAVCYELNMAFQKAIACAKKIKTNTEISNMPLSISTLVANEVFHFEKEEKTVLLLGVTGKIGSDVAKNLLCKKNVRIIATVRSEQKVLEIADKRLFVIPYAKRYAYLDEADIIISATKSPHYTICEKEAKKAIETSKKRLFLDLAMPRDIDPNIGRMKGVKLLNIDHFDTISKINGTHKLEELDRAVLIMEEEKAELMKELEFHRYQKQIPEWKAMFEKMPLEKLLYRMKKSSDVESMKTVFQVLSGLSSWVKDE